MVDMLDVMPLIAKRKAESEARSAYQSQAQQQAAIDMKVVTASREWNVYLQHLQALVEEDQRALDSHKARLLGDVGMADAERDTLVRRMKKLEGRLEARHADMALPVTVMQGAEKSVDNA